MLMYLFYAIRSFFWWAGNKIRKNKKGPEYILFTLEGDYPMIPVVSSNPFLRLIRPPKISLMELSSQLRTVAQDPRVKGIVFVLRSLSMPLAKMDVLRDSFAELRAACKRVVVWSYTYDTNSYYLASAADQILLLPGGSLHPMGLYFPYTFLADALTWLGVKADFIQISPYKSAMDTLMRTTMSDEVREMGNWLADATYNVILAAIAEGRKIERETAADWIDQTPCTDLRAKELGAVDELLGEDDLPTFLGEGESAVKLVPWESAMGKLLRRPLKKPGKYIALMTIEGLILDGRSGKPPVEPPVPVPMVMDARAGDISVVQTVRQIMADKRAAAVVLYVDSRGGSATASESMRIALQKLAAIKPLVVVMGPVAASGGYWVSTPGKLILAQPSTITGSIGVLTGKIADTGLMQKLMIHQETIQRGENVAIFATDSPFSQQERERMLAYIQRVYRMFLERVADSRGMETSQVETIAGGRVYTGMQALENGLVDETGGLEQAFIKAREFSGLDERAPIRLFIPPRGTFPPVSEPAALWRYAIENLSAFSSRAMVILPWIEKR